VSSRSVVADASALATIVFGEEGAETVLARLEGAAVHVPALLKFELTSAAVKKARQNPRQAAEFIQRLDSALDPRRGLRWHDIDASDVAIIARATGLSAYDASYLWLAGRLEADLVTLDRRLSAAMGLDSERID
jgi:predicted nucleic acid-binding protein